MTKGKYEYDIFLSHAVEDKIPIANELCKYLDDKKLTVWYSGEKLTIGDLVTESIYRALDQCRFGVVILSPTYVTKVWALKELFILEEKEKSGQKVILPILYNITPEELAAKSIKIADRFAIRAEKGLDHVTEKLFEEIIRQYQKGQDNDRVRSFRISRHFLFNRYSLFIAATLIIGLLVLLSSHFKLFEDAPDVTFIGHSIQKRIDAVQEKADAHLQNITQQEKGKPATLSEIRNLYTDYLNVQSYYRNEYNLITYDQVIRSRKNVQAALLLDLEALTPFNLYGLTSPKIYRSYPSSITSTSDAKYSLYNTQAVLYTIEELEHGSHLHQIKVTYDNSLRLISGSLTFPSGSTDTKRYQVTLVGLRSPEIYTFAEQNGAWILKTVE